ncbi:hypothetical protein TIFTF001_003728 [Ficus carica]|uniref:Uncharacterized protein n=1 Tax=Ficus carica TaxID=3494 RepID=A0AA87ZSY9_FICCA|nr:hypothetical protein TIFTF001_003728 [Ficus carica]
MNCRNDPNLSSTSCRFAFIVFHRTRSDTVPMSYSRIHSSSLCIPCPFERFASAGEAKAVVARMLASNPQFPFYAIDRRSVEPVLLERLDGAITRISEAAARIAREASESGCNVAQMLIKIDKRTVIPHHNFEEVRLLNHIYEDDDDDSEDDDNEDEPELNGAIEQSFVESAMAFESVPAAKSVVEALEKFKYEGSCEDHEDESKLIETKIASHIGYIRLILVHSVVTNCPAKFVDVEGKVWIGAGGDPAEARYRSATARVTARVVATDEAVVEGLEKMTYEGCSEQDGGESKLTIKCVICMEEVMIGSQLIRLPCSFLAIALKSGYKGKIHVPSVEVVCNYH